MFIEHPACLGFKLDALVLEAGASIVRAPAPRRSTSPKRRSSFAQAEKIDAPMRGFLDGRRIESVEGSQNEI